MDPVAIDGYKGPRPSPTFHSMRFPLLLSVLLLVSMDAGAAPPTWYVDAGVGVNIADNESLNDNGALARFDLTAPIASLAFGRHVGEHWRVEAELAYGDSDLESFFWPSADDELWFDHTGGVSSTSLMLNAIRRFPLGAVEPYFGAGIGTSRLSYKLREQPYASDSTPILEDDADAFAFQLIAGLELHPAPRWGLGFDYRLWQAPDVDVVDVDGVSHGLRHTTHSFQAHLRYLFSGTWQTPDDVPEPPGTGWYVGASLGTGFAMDSEVKDSVDNLDAFQAAPLFALSAGNALTPHWRLEVALERIRNKVEVVDFNPETGQHAATGRVTATSLLAAAAYQFRAGRAVRPFVAVGAGAAWLDYYVETPRLEGRNVVPGRDLYLDDKSSTAPVVQLQLGLNMALSARLDLVADYRSWYSDPVKLARPDGSDYETWHWVQSFNLGLRYSL
ncbi:MAG: outer membrane beta-barrel protein [Pseudomonadales bacterium]|jgi:opacity protein-like surface antigen